MMTTEILAPVADTVEVALNFRAMNTRIELLIYTDASEAERAVKASQQLETLFTETEARLSRFRPESELSQLNRQGYLENASEMLYENIVTACQMQQLTNGIFDATILEALEAAGYDRSFELLGNNKTPQLFSRPLFPKLAIWRDPIQTQRINLDPVERNIQLAPGVRVDLGGIAKGSTVDRAAELLRSAGFESFMISAGGDMYLQGCPPQDPEGWTVGVENEALGGSGDIASLHVSNKAIATSSTTGRRWMLSGQTRHHLIDPRTQQPAETNLAAVTVVAEKVQMADVLAKTALILGPAQTAQMRLKEKGQVSKIIFVTLQGELLEI